MAQSGMGLLRVTPAKLQAKANDFENSAKEFHAITDEMFEIIKQLTGVVWSGTAAQQYTSNFNALEDDRTRMVELIKEFTRKLNEMASEYTSAEADNEQIAMSLKTDVIA